MLRLKRVELQGFKSFCERTELRFNGGGIAAIVGPNGCGKSNLSDAISWVLGEQSAKSLRGARMEDVIFAGTRDRKPLGMAYVTMTLVDPEHHREGHSHPPKTNGHANGGTHPPLLIPAHSETAHSAKTLGEITITRRLYRSGESEYLIDGKAARLRDIQELFMGSGLGPECYAIIEQGRIGQILSSKPQDRRSVVEEAAGITKYKTKRRLAEAKLESAKQNLSRVFDILEEVGRQVNSLKRQASKARRYVELKAELDARLRVMMGTRFRYLETEAVRLAQEVGGVSEEQRALTESVQEKERELESTQATCYQTEAELTEARGRLADLNVESERTRGKLESQAQQCMGIEERIAQGENESEEIRARLALFESDVATHQQRVAALELQASQARQKVIEKNQVRERVQSQLIERQKALESGRLQILRLLGEAAALQNQLAQIEEFLAGIDRESVRAEREEREASGELERLAAAKKSLSVRLSERQLELESVSTRRQRTEETLAGRKRDAAELRQTLDALRAEFSQAKARKDSLEEILSHRAYTTESVKRLFGAVEQGQASGFRPVGVLADFVEVDPAFEKAAEEFLHEELEYVVVENWGQAEQGIDLIRRDLDGRATFLVHPTEGSALPSPATSPESGVVARLADHLRLVNGLGKCSMDLLPRLSRCYLTEDRPAAQQLALQHPDLYFLLPDGVCYHGFAVSGGKKTGAGPLALKRELRELHQSVRTQERDLEQKTALLAGIEREMGQLEAEIEHLRTAQQTQEKDALALEHEVRKLAEESARANSKLSMARMEIDRLGQERQRSLDQREKNQVGILTREEARRREEGLLEQARQELEDLETEAARTGEEHAAVRVELAAADERLRAEKAAVSRTETQMQELRVRRKALEEEVERLGVHRAHLLADNLDLERKGSVLANLTLETDALITEMAQREGQLRATLANTEETLKQVRLELGGLQERKAQLEVDLARRQTELQYLDETSRKELNLAASDLVSGGEEALDAEALAQVEQAFQEIKAKIDALGPVNPQALEEYQETQQRYDFLNTQRQDLLDSIRDTEKAIKEIDLVTRQKFAEAFEAVNANFRQAFQTLFGGGTGEMRLTDETNLAESGIEIVASPPGKRLQNVLLLSGGEKALTALALLMAIFRYQPSPFCILDEVDAPLDEANIERLMRLIKEMSRETQFVLITHSKKTMEAAQALYGVTMQEAGVSRLVTVRFHAIPEVEPRAMVLAHA